MFNPTIRTFSTAAELMKKNTIVKHYAGSISYGTNLPTSDVDLRGIFCADPVNILTPFYTVRECSDVDEEDTKLYEMAHFFKLCLDCNPNIVETLWVDDSDITFRTDAYDFIRKHRSDFLSSKIAFTTSGYALAQLKRIKGHNKWINNPQPKEPPRQTHFVSLVQWYGEEKIMPRDFSLENFYQGYRLVPYGGDVLGLYKVDDVYTSFNPDTFALNTNFDGERTELPMPIAVVKFLKEEYKLQKEKHNQYWTWKNNRNEARSELEEAHGYDTKHAMHLVRLLRMGHEALETGQIIVKRPDAEELLAIRNGSMTYEEIVEYAEDMDDMVRNKLYKTTDLPKKPNMKRVAQLLMDTQFMVWNWV